MGGNNGSRSRLFFSVVIYRTVRLPSSVQSTLRDEDVDNNFIMTINRPINIYLGMFPHKNVLVFYLIWWFLSATINFIGDILPLFSDVPTPFVLR